MYPAYESVLCRVEDRVATVTINRPQMNNALDPVAYVDIRDVFQRLSTDSEVGAVILTGAGRNFSAPPWASLPCGASSPQTADPHSRRNP